MSESGARIREAAQRIADWHLQDAEFCIVYEDEWRQVHDLIQHSRAALPTATPSRPVADNRQETPDA